MKRLILILTTISFSACSAVGDNGVEDAPYVLLEADSSQKIEVRNYESMVLVSAPMNNGGSNSAFRKLFKYISGANEGSKEIAMTAPVFTNKKQQGTKIPMTAPVFIDENTTSPVMSFVMPEDFTLNTTPKPIDPTVKVSQISDYKVATIKFSGFMSESNVQKHTEILLAWINKNGFESQSFPVTAGYNGPFTLPFMRRNEILIEVR